MLLLSLLVGRDPERDVLAVDEHVTSPQSESTCSTVGRIVWLAFVSCGVLGARLSSRILFRVPFRTVSHFLLPVIPLLIGERHLRGLPLLVLLLVSLCSASLTLAAQPQCKRRRAAARGEALVGAVDTTSA